MTSLLQIQCVRVFFQEPSTSIISHYGGSISGQYYELCMLCGVPKLEQPFIFVWEEVYFTPVRTFQETRSDWCSIVPMDLIKLIILNMEDSFDLFQLSQVCKKFFNLLHDHEFVFQLCKLHLTIQPTNEMETSLPIMYHYNNTMLTTFSYYKVMHWRAKCLAMQAYVIIINSSMIAGKTANLVYIICGMTLRNIPFHKFC